MEPLYEYFYEIQGYSLAMMITYVALKPYIIYRFNRSKFLIYKNRKKLSKIAYSITSFAENKG